METNKKYPASKGCLLIAVVVIAAIVSFLIIRNDNNAVLLDEIFGDFDSITKCQITHHAWNYFTTQDYDGKSDLGDDITVDVAKTDLRPFTARFEELVRNGIEIIERDAMLKLQYEYSLSLSVNNKIQKFQFIFIEEDSEGYLAFSKADRYGYMPLYPANARELQAIIEANFSND